MYRSSEQYEELAKTVIEIYLDYNINKFPLDEKEIASKLGVSLIPYTDCDERALELLVKKTPYGFFVKGCPDNPPTIYFNDQNDYPGSVRFTIFHEFKHYVFNEDDDNSDKDDLADFFARYFMCPIPYLILKGIDSLNEIMSTFGLTMTAASHVIRNLENRKKTYGTQIFRHEEPLLEQLDKTAYEIYRKNHRKGDDNID